MYGKRLRGLALSTFALLTLTLALVFFWAPNDAYLGFLQKIFYVHVPLAIVTLCGFVAGGVVGAEDGVASVEAVVDGDVVGVDAPVGRGLDEIPRLAVGAGGMGAAFVAPGEALVDAVAVRPVGDDEHTAVGRCNGGGGHENTGQNCGYGSHAAPDEREERPQSIDPKR